MPRILLNRIGDDNLVKLEAAATRRHAEARRLAAGERLGSLYLYGYTIEIRLKAAYYRLIGLAENWNLDVPIDPAPDSPRRQAERAIRSLLPAPAPNSVGHHLVGWATLLIDTRSHHRLLSPYAPGFVTQLSNHAQAAGRQWREILRYRANRPYDEELDEVVDAANWVRRNYQRLWS